MKNKGKPHPDCPWETGRTPPQRKICFSTWGQFCIVVTRRKIVFSKYPMWDLASQSMSMLVSCCEIHWNHHSCLTCKVLWTGYVKYNSQVHSDHTWQWSDITMAVHCVWYTLINISIWILLSNYLPSPAPKKEEFLLFASLDSNDLLTARQSSRLVATFFLLHYCSLLHAFGSGYLDAFTFPSLLA